MNPTTATALAELVAAIGGSDFARRFLATMRMLAGAELCSAFRRDARQVNLLFAEGDRPVPPGVALAASRDYVRGYWRSDPQIAQPPRAAGAAPLVVRRHASAIADPAYRIACYDRMGVVERLSIVGGGRSGFMLNAYRTTRQALSTPDDMGRLESCAPLLIAAVERHARADAASGHLLNESTLVASLLGLRCGLSTREAEISAAMILGETQDEIAQRKQLSTASVVTYRRRAYGKLGIDSRRDLLRLHRRLLTGDHELPLAN